MHSAATALEAMDGHRYETVHVIALLRIVGHEFAKFNFVVSHLPRDTLSKFTADETLIIPVTSGYYGSFM